MQDEHAKSLEMAVAASPATSDPQSNLRMDDINIPLVAVVVACFVAVVAVVIIFLQAAFYTYRAGEQARKTLPQEDVHTELGAMLAEQRRELERGPGERRLAAGGTATSAASQAKRDAVPIGEAMRVVSGEYSERRLP
jgi:hypothetical protein